MAPTKRSCRMLAASHGVDTLAHLSLQILPYPGLGADSDIIHSNLRCSACHGSNAWNTDEAERSQLAASVPGPT